MAHDVFISYSSKDKPIADAVCANIEATGIRCWIAPRDIAPGEDWPTAITKAISNSQVMVLIFSANSNSSEDVGRELMLAANSKLVIIPFKIENVEPEPGKQYYLARTHWLDAINPPTQAQINTLIERVKVLIPIQEPSSPGGPPVGFAPTVQPVLKKPLAPPVQLEPASGKKGNWLRYFWIPISLFLLALIGWFVLTFWPPTLPTPLAATAATTAKVTIPVFASKTPTPKAEAPVMTPVPLNWNVSVSDGFLSNENGWPTWSNENDGCSDTSLDVQSGALVWTIDATGNNNCGYLVYPDIPAVSDFDLSLDLKGSTGTGKADFGIAFRILDSSNHYIFVISTASRSFRVGHLRNDSLLTLIDWKFDSAINSDESNHLAISARGSDFYFYINDTLVDTMEDSGIAAGNSGVIIRTYNGGDVSVSYDNFMLRGIR